MIDRVLSIMFILILITIIISSYLEVPIVEGMNNDQSRQLGKLEARVDTLNKNVNELMTVVKGTNLKKIKNFSLLDKMHKQTNLNKKNIDKLAQNSTEASIADSA